MNLTSILFIICHIQRYYARTISGAPEPVIQEKPDTKERIWFDFNEWESKFFQELEVQEIIDLASAADYLQVAALYLYW